VDSKTGAALTNRARLRQAGINLSKLEWFLSMTDESALDQLPPDSLFLPGQETRNRETVIDLATGRPHYLRQTVPPGMVLCLLQPLKPIMRTEAVVPSSSLPNNNQ
jgi:hypothetical protein